MILVVASLAWARPASIGAADAKEHPIRCHWERAEDEELCDTVLAWAAVAWDAQVDTIGFSAPPADAGAGGSDALDIYVGVTETSEAGEAWVDCDGGDGTCDDTDAADGRASAPSYVVIDARTDADAIPGYVVHEFAHTLQYATDWAEPFLVLWEGTAVACEMWSLPEVDPSASDLADYQATPWLSAVLQDGYYLWDEHEIWSWYEYGAMAWVRWADDRYGDGAGSGVLALWEAATQEGYGLEPDVLDAWEVVAGTGWEGEMLAFAGDRARMGEADGPPWASFAGESARVARDAIQVGDGETVSPTMPLFPLGAAYFDVNVQAMETVAVSLEADPAFEWGVVFVEAGEDNAASQAYAASYQASYQATTSTGVTVAVVNLGPTGLDADDPLEAATFTLGVRVLDAPDGMYRDTGGDGAGDDREDADGGCGCGGGAASGWAALVALAWIASRQPPNSPSTGRGGDPRRGA